MANINPTKISVRVDNLHKFFGDSETRLHVLNDISLQIPAGEFVAIMGKSGAGKSTLLYQLSALDDEYEGEINIAGTNLKSLSDNKLMDFRLNTLGYVFQDYALIQDLSALENVLLPLLMRGLPWGAAETKAKDALIAVGLEQRLNYYSSQMSGGEQQRVAIARAIAGQPQILFADEPTANLDSASGRLIIDLLTTLHHHGQTIIMVTHEEEYATACSRIIYLEDGKIKSDTHKERTPASSLTTNSDTTIYTNPVYEALQRVTSPNPTII